MKKTILKLTRWTGGFFFVGGSILVAGFIYLSFGLPDTRAMGSDFMPKPSRIYDRSGVLLYEIQGDVKRTPVDFSSIPGNLIKATLAAEDDDFYHHPGIDIKSILRAAKVNIFSGSKQQGASTITQQLARTAFLTQEKSYRRKLNEMVLAIEIERRYTKNEILSMYLNDIPYGSTAYGIEAASETYFNKKASDLTLLESTYLAALPKAPTYYSPFGPNRSQLEQRVRGILARMKNKGWITEDEYRSALDQKVVFEKAPVLIRAPHFVFYVEDYLAARLGEQVLQQGGLEIYTTLDYGLQQEAEKVVNEELARVSPRYDAENAALVAIDPKSGGVLAMVGSKNYFDKNIDGEVNVATRPRQPGSSFKPYVYARAFEEGMTPATLLMDVRTNFKNENDGKNYIPRNYDGKYRGPVSVRTALQGSLNVPAVKTLLLTGIGNVIDLAEKMGITTLKNRDRYGPALVLGGGEVELLDHTSAFGVFAAGGVRHPVNPILQIKDSQGNVVDANPSSEIRVLDPQIAYLMNNILSDNDSRTFIFGRNNRLTLADRPVAVKTGTTQEYRDAWTIGYTPSFVTGVWVGNNDNRPMKFGADGSIVAAPIWNRFMETALKNTPVESFPRPPEIVEVAVDALTGKLPTSLSPQLKKEVFASFAVPTASDDFHVSYNLFGSEVRLTRFVSEKPDDPEWEQPVRQWAEARGFASGSQTELLARKADEIKNGTLNISFSVPSRIETLPWEVTVAARLPDGENVDRVNLYLDDRPLISHTTGSFQYAGVDSPGNGSHVFRAEVISSSKEKYVVTKVAQFAVRPALLSRE